MKRGAERARDAAVGVVVTLAAVIFAAGIFSIGSESRLWASKVAYKLKLPNTGGLGVGSPVTLAGVQVGTVTSIELPADPNILAIDVEFTVDSAVQERIREDTEASLKILSMLAGDKYVELTPGSPSLPALPPGSYVKVPQALGFEEMQALGATIAEDLQEVTASLAVILNQIQDPNTFLGQALFDPNFGRHSLASIRESIDSTREVIKRIEQGRGLVGRFLSDEEFADEMAARMEGSMARMERLLDRLADSDGALMRVLDPNGPMSDILRNLDSTAASLNRITGAMEEGEGLAGRLLSDDPYAAEVLENMRQASRDLRDIVGKLNSGEGSAGALINDPAIYEELRDVLRGVRESRVMSWLIRRYREKGEKARIREMEEREKALPEEDDDA